MHVLCITYRYKLYTFTQNTLTCYAFIYYKLLRGNSINCGHALDVNHVIKIGAEDKLCLKADGNFKYLMFHN